MLSIFSIILLLGKCSIKNTHPGNKIPCGMSRNEFNRILTILNKIRGLFLKTFDLRKNTDINGQMQQIFVE